MSRLVPPGSTIGILGAGQLGRMLAVCARQHGYRVIVFGGDRNTPCGQVSDRAWNAGFDDEDALKEFAAAADVVTYEFENISAAAAAAIATHTTLAPGVELLQTAQNRFLEKSAIAALGIPTARFRMVHSEEELKAACQDFGGAVIMKSNTDGYDGKGQWSVADNSQAAAAWHEARAEAAIVEQRIHFDYELSVIAGRFADGTCCFYEPFLNHHANHILDVTVSGAPQITAKIRKQAEQIARAILERFGVVGVLCVELFLNSDGELLVNEIAPRPHNSGHLTIEAFNCSQFEVQLRAICRLPATLLNRRYPAAAMANLLGQHLPPVWTAESLTAFSESRVHLHLYGKPSPRENRKMGHITAGANTATDAENLTRNARSRLKSNNS
ncbi:MAG: 5-(carboxyamino)imidazole ribonucleotide synthase [Planctomycetaceae bacterium]